VIFPSHPNTIARDSIQILFDEIDTLEDKFGDITISTVAAVLNEVGRDGVSDEIQQWFHATFGDEPVFEVPDWTVIEHAITSQRSIFAYDPEAAGYPWDAEKADTVREIYTDLAAYVESQA
jgi:chromosome partitioning protein